MSKATREALQHPLPTEVLSYRQGYEAQNGTVVQYQPEWTKQHQLEGDGLLPLLYDHLWKSDRTREHRLRDVLIPDTVVFEHNFPRAWYTYDSKTQELLKRAGKLLDSQSIYKYFAAEEKGTDIVAQFYHKSTTSTVPADHSPSKGHHHATHAKHHHHHGAVEEEEELTTSVEFFTKDKLFDFLHNRKVKPDGVLQKFLVPKGESSSRHNFQIQAVWSPLVTLVYKRTNKRRLNDKTVPVNDRAATFDGPAHCSAEGLVADGTKSRIDNLCKTIVDHFFATEHKQITRAVLYFKVDDADRLWVLWASSLRIGSDKLNPSYLRVPMLLAMRVENVNGGSSREEISSARKQMQRELVDKDVALYNLTGDWAFASQCATRMLEGGEGVAAAAADGDVDDPADANAVRLLTMQPAPPPKSRVVVTYKADGGHGGESPPRRAQSPPAPMAAFISPRAPFLPTVQRQTNSDVHSPRHPLHRAYCKTHDSAAASDAPARLASPANGSSRRGGRGEASSSAPRQKKYTVKIRRTEKETIYDELTSLTHDILYDAYSTTMQTSSHLLFVADPEQVTYTMPKEVTMCLRPEHVDELLMLLRLRPKMDVDPSAAAGEYVVASGALGRGRRQDRPLAQIVDDVKAFFGQLLLTESEESDLIVEHWRAMKDNEGME